MPWIRDVLNVFNDALAELAALYMNDSSPEASVAATSVPLLQSSRTLGRTLGSKLRRAVATRADGSAATICIATN